MFFKSQKLTCDDPGCTAAQPDLGSVVHLGYMIHPFPTRPIIAFPLNVAVLKAALLFLFGQLSGMILNGTP
jgi:hypothetical protein